MNEANVRETKGRILVVAERLFAQQGIEATSLRQITTEAEVNLAAVNYHFNSKDELVKNVYLRRIRPMNEARLERLRLAEEHHPGDLDVLLDAFYEPVLELAHSLTGEFTVGKFLGRLYTEPHGVASAVLTQEMGETVKRFSTALTRLLPHLTQREIFWRMHFTIGLLAHTIGAGEKMRQLSQGLVDMSNREEVLREMKQYAKAGLLAPGMERAE